MTSTQKNTDALLDELLKGCRTPEEILGERGLVKQLTKRDQGQVLPFASLESNGISS